MKGKEGLLKCLLPDSKMISDLRQLLDEELGKTDDERDYDTIMELTSSIMNIAEDDYPPVPNTDDILKKAAERKRNKFTVLRKCAIGLSACFIAGMAANCYSLISYGQNIFDLIMKKSKSGITLNLSAHQNEENPDATYPQYQYGENEPAQTAEYVDNCIIDFCREYDFMPYVPGSFPPEIAYDGVFEMTESHYECMTESDDFYFTFSNGNEQQFTITLEKYRSADELPEMLIPSDDYSVKEEVVNGTPIFAFPNDNISTAVFVHDEVCYTINGYNISADAIMKLASGFVPASMLSES